MGVRPPGVTSVIVIVVALAAVGAILDRLVLSNRLESWRRGVRRLWLKLNTPGARDLSQDAHKLFCALFDLIYGRHAFTWRRVWSSSLSSVLALAVVTLALGYENTPWRNVGLVRDLDLVGGLAPLLMAIILGFLATFSNLIPDFFSLVETRWVLSLARGKGALSIAFLLALDLVLTSAIFLSGLVAFGFLYTMILPTEESEFGFGELIAFAVGPDGLIFFLTTFVTSFFWIAFVLTFFLIWLLHRTTPLAKFVFYEIGRSDAPASTLAAYTNVALIFGYLLWGVFAWTFAS